MSDKEIIIALLKNVEWRLRINGLLNELALGLSIVLSLLVALKVRDLFSPFTAGAIAIAISGCAFLYAGFALWRIRQTGTLGHAAASLDQKAGLYDEMKTAFWFINNPRSSEWTDRQLQRAAGKAGKIDLARAYPSVIPRSSYTAALMVLLFAGLNFLPLPLNHNWLLLQAAPSAGLSDAGQGPLRNARILNSSALSESAGARLAEIRRGLEEIATDLLASEKLRNLAQAIMEHQAGLAAREMRGLSAQIQSNTPSDTQQMQRAFEKASANSLPAIEQLTKNMGDLARALELKDSGAADAAIERIAEELESLEGELKEHETDGGQIAGGRDAPLGGEGSQPPKDGEPPRSDGNTSGLGASQGTESGEREPPPTLAAKLQADVQLELEGIRGPRSQGIPSSEEIEEASRRDRSTLDYRNVKSELASAQEDVLNGERIPWKYRSLIKGYFHAIRPPLSK